MLRAEATNPPAGDTPREKRAAILDPGWLFLLAGLALVGATALISAQHDAALARWARDRVLAAEAHRNERLARHEEFLGALEQRQPALVESLAAAQLNQIPAERAAIPGTVRDLRADASVFPALEPPPLRLAPAPKPRSTLAKWAVGERSRMWVYAGGTLMILIGLLPSSRGWGRPESGAAALARRASNAARLVEPKSLTRTLAPRMGRALRQRVVTRGGAGVTRDHAGTPSAAQDA
jgi:hypothetical protein